jgi:hypothetical protein
MVAPLHSQGQGFRVGPILILVTDAAGESAVMPWTSGTNLKPDRTLPEVQMSQTHAQWRAYD